MSYRSSLKKSISDFISNSMARIESVRATPSTDSPLVLASVADSQQNTHTLSPPSVPIVTDHKSQSMVDTRVVGGSKDEEDLQIEERRSRRVESAKAVQLIKWRDLPGREDYYISAPNRYVLESPDQVGEFGHESSDQHPMMNQQSVGESPSMQEEISLPDSSSSTTRDHQLSAVLKSNMIAFTSF